MRRSAGVDVEAMPAGAPDRSQAPSSTRRRWPSPSTPDRLAAGPCASGATGGVVRAAGAARRSVELRALSPAMATALVGGINELVLATVEEGGADRLDRLDASIVEPVESVLGRGEPVPA